MRKSLFISVFFISLSIFTGKSQTLELWGTAYAGGHSDLGVIFKTDANGNNLDTVFCFRGIPGRRPIYAKLCLASNGKFYGVTHEGGANNFGILYEYDPATNTYTKKWDFEKATGALPAGSLIQANNGKLYGMTIYGGAHSDGVIFEYDPATGTYTKKYDFNGTDGNFPAHSLIQASDGNLYGVTNFGGANNRGVLFEYNPTYDYYNKLWDFDGNSGAYPTAALVQASNGKLYGSTTSGGAHNNGVLFEFDPATSTFTKKFDFDINSGNNPNGALYQASDGKLYGLTADGGAHNEGVLFQFDPVTGSYTKKFDFDYNNGSNPFGALTEASNGKLYGTTTFGGANNKGVLFEYDPATDNLTKRFDFDNIHAHFPYTTLVRHPNGKLYGITSYGGSSNSGVIFEFDITTGNCIKDIDFGSSEGSNPRSVLVLAPNEKFYGLTLWGGANGYGTLFEYDPATGIYTKKHDFNFDTGIRPFGSLMLASNGKLYGMTQAGGGHNFGTIFEYDISTGTYTVKFHFNRTTSGSSPFGSLIQASNGKLYGMTEFGGANDAGVLFEYDLSTGTYTKKFDFSENQGKWPYGSLVEATNGKLYGITSSGGSHHGGVLFEYDPATGIYSKKYEFAYGDRPFHTLMQASNGKLYGLTRYGGSNNLGTLFEYDLSTGTYQIKFDFDGQNNGARPLAPLMQASNGKIYGSTYKGGLYDKGVMFEYDPATDSFTKKFDFDEIHGTYPFGALVEVNNHFSTPKSLRETVRLYPNPTSGIIRIIMPQKPVRVSVESITGARILTTNRTAKIMSIDLSGYAGGIYLINIQMKNSALSYKIIKE